MNSTNSPLISIADLVAERHGRVLFKGLALDIQSGESVAILGPSGSGKSSLLEILFAVNRFSVRGQLQVQHKHASAVLQQGALFEHLSVGENLALVARYRGQVLAPASQRELLSRVNLPADYATRAVNQLSGGEYRRVAIARALVGEPQLVVFDEPEAGLDPANTRELAALLRSLNQEQGRALLLLTHDTTLAAAVAERILLLQAGQLIALGVPALADAPNGTGLIERRDRIESELLQQPGTVIQTESSTGHPPRRFAVTQAWLRGLGTVAGSMFRRIPSWRDYLSMCWRMFSTSFVAGAGYYFLVGAMLGAVVVAILQTLTTRESLGVLSYVLTPRFALELLRGAYVVYLAPAMAAILFVARAGSIITAWLGSLQYSGQITAMRLLRIDPASYLWAPGFVGLFFGFLATAVLVGGGIWFGSVAMAYFVIGMADAATVLDLNAQMFAVAQVGKKLGLYSLLVAASVVGLGLAPKARADDVSRHTTGAIILVTMAVAIIELAFALTT